MLTRSPSPKRRSTSTPGRWESDSARFWSGNLPTSSAVMTSTFASETRLTDRDCARLAAYPLTTNSFMVTGSSLAAGTAPGATAAAVVVVVVVVVAGAVWEKAGPAIPRARIRRAECFHSAVDGRGWPLLVRGSRVSGIL